MKTRIKMILFFACTLLLAESLFAQAPDGYYTGVKGKNKADLKTAFYSVISNHTALSYNGLWNAFKTTDKKSNGKVWDMYSDVPNGTPPYEFNFGGGQCGSYKNEGDCYNREHSFPKSWFGDASPMYTDLFHLYPTDGKVNGMRGNLPYGNVGVQDFKSKNGTLRGTSAMAGYSGQVFEPIDEYKGDFARTYFYMVTCYEDRISGWGSPHLNGSKYPAFNNWSITFLLEWSRMDPVSQKEIDRNNAVYGYQHNRNPFIDFPGLEEYIWGNKQDASFDPQNPGETDPRITVDPAALSFQTFDLGVAKSNTILVKGYDLTGNIAVNITGDPHFTSITGSISKADAENGYTITVNYTPTAYETNTATLTLNGGGLADDVNVALTGVAKEQGSIVAGNVLINPSFETWSGGKAEPWDFYAGNNANVVYSQETSIVNDGASALRINNPSTGTTANVSQSFSDNLTEGDKYALSFDYYVVSGDGSDVRIWSGWKSKTGTTYTDIDHDHDVLRIGKTNPDDYLPSNTGTWSNYKCETTVPADAATFDFRVRSYRGSVVIFDNFTLANMTHSSIEDGKIDSGINVYTTQGYVNIDVSDTDARFVEIYDVMGRLLIKKEVNGGNNQIAMTSGQLILVKIGNSITKLLTR
ncbi:MAG: endonuclease [Dysgonomonas sp.]